MASIRASIVNQARTAATALVAGSDRVDAGDCPVVDQLVRCARLSEDAATTLDWAADTLRAHSTTRADQLACQLLAAARARLDTRPVTADTARRRLAWI